ncbi:MAG: archease [Candidatus Micrarchaeota archaeon]|nr:archease [Candidatus Micrarchaeota archaeon]
MRFRFVDHTADVEFIAYGKDLEELFSNALQALFETMADTKALKRSKVVGSVIIIDEAVGKSDEVLWRTLQDTLSTAESMGVFAYAVASLRVGKEKSRISCFAKILAKEKKDKYSKLPVKGVAKYELGIKDGTPMEARVVLDV